MFLDILNRYFKGFYMPKNTFFEGTKKFSVQNNFWDFLYMYKGGLCKKNTGAYVPQEVSIKKFWSKSVDPHVSTLSNIVAHM